MKKQSLNLIDIEVDMLTNSITNAVTGEVFNTEITLMQLPFVRQIKKKEWVFDWSKEMKNKDRAVYKLTTTDNADIIQGLISVEDKQDHIFMHLIETAKFNKGKDKMYFGVPGNLVAFACKLSFDKGYDGYLVFEAKSALIKHYEVSLGATHFKGLRMIIETPASIKLITQYFKK